jgi:ribulose 1,5-bisphosphate synthetase/thiazole synthase
MIAGAMMIGAGGLIWLAGMIISGSAVISAGRQWLRDLDVPPSEVVKDKWHQTKAATAAGSAAWQQHDGMHRAHA